MTYSSVQWNLSALIFLLDPRSTSIGLTTTGDLTLINRMGRGALRIHLFNLRF